MSFEAKRKDGSKDRKIKLVKKEERVKKMGKYIQKEEGKEEEGEDRREGKRKGVSEERKKKGKE